MGNHRLQGDIVCVVGLEYVSDFVIEEVMRSGLGSGGGLLDTRSTSFEICWMVIDLF